jgi:hypothetical protein
MATKPAPPRPPKRPFRKRYAVLLTMLGVLAIVLAVAVVRGTWADKEPRDPSSSSEGVLCRLYQPPEGDWQIRCSMVLDHNASYVWDVVSDYKNFADIFPTLKSCNHQYSRDYDGAILTGEAHSMLGTWPFHIEVKHEKKFREYHSHWEGDSGDLSSVQKLSGSWTVTWLGLEKTLLVYTSHVEIESYPDWVVVNALLFRQPKVMKAVQARLEKKE